MYLQYKQSELLSFSLSVTDYHANYYGVCTIMVFIFTYAITIHNKLKLIIYTDCVLH